MKKLIALIAALSLCLTASCSVAELDTAAAPAETEEAALTEDTAEETAEETPAAPSLPIDLSAGPVADESCYTENGYQDATITVEMSRETIDNCCYNVAHVKIGDASQLRTALAADFGKSKTNKISTIARNNNAIVAIGGDYYSDRKNGYIVRQGQTYRKMLAKTLDILFICEKGDFHIIKSSSSDGLKAVVEGGCTPINVFNFGPALVIDGEVQDTTVYGNFHPTGKEPRCAIGQIGPLEYLLVVADGRDAGGSKGCTCATLAQFMKDRGCVQAFNLDGGNSALMVFHGENYSKKSFSAERSVSDIIYFATAIQPE